MKTDKIFIGTIVENLDDDLNIASIIPHQLLYAVGPHSYYSPKYHQRFMDVQNYNEPYVKDLKLFNYQILSQLDSISRIKLMKIYQQYLKNLVLTSKLYLADIVKGNFSDVNTYEDIELIKIKEEEEANKVINYELIEENALLELVGDNYILKNKNQSYKDWPTNTNHYYVRNIRLVNIPKILNRRDIPYDEAEQIIKRKLNK